MDLQSDNNAVHLGILISSLEESCQSKLWKGIEQQARTLGLNLTVYLSTFQQKDGTLEEHYSVVFDDIIANDTLDGLILFSGFIAEDIGTDAVEKFVSDCKNIPMVSLAMSFPGIPSLLVNNRSGIYDTIRHLVEKHSFSSIAFVKGPEDHEEAQARFQGYKDALKDSSITIAEELILPGHFSDWSGEEAVTTLLDERKIKPEAIVCADDETAIGVIKELSRRNIAVPEEIAVCGFDDEEYASIITPALTTARQPFEEMGKESINLLLAQLNKTPVEELQLLSTQFIQRQSCGCVSYTASKEPALLQGSSLEEKMCDFAQSAFPKSLPSSTISKWTCRILNEIKRSFSLESFLHVLDIVLIDTRQHQINPLIWSQFLTELLTVTRDSNEETVSFENLAEATILGMQLIHTAVDRNFRYETLKQSENQWEIRGIAQELVTSFNLEALTTKLKSGAEELGINTVMIFLYNEPCLYSKWVRPEYVTYILGFNKEGDIRPDLQELLIPTGEICDFITMEHQRIHSSLFYMPLFFGDEQIGVMLLEYNPESPLDMYETIRINVATALKGAYLFEQIEHQSFTDEMTQLYNRRGFITFSLSRMAHLRRTSSPSTLFFIDMDGLKLINDTHGHKAGDHAIQTCAAIIEDSLREGDIIGRMGGDEFTVFASDVTPEQTDDIIIRLRAAFKQFNEESTLPYQVNCSIGIHALNDYSEEAFEKALHQADELLYKEKREKRDQGLSRS